MEDLWLPGVISEGGPRIVSNVGAVGESGLPGANRGARRGRRPMGNVWQLVVKCLKDLNYEVT